MRTTFHSSSATEVYTAITGAVTDAVASIEYGKSPLELYEPIRYIMSLSGKRMRPTLALLGSYLFTDQWQSFVRPAIAVEVFHNFTLMHDDIMDAAPLRRGQPTVHQKWNNNVAILSGDVMLVKAYELLLDLPAAQLPAALRRFNRCAADVCEGQQLDMNFETQPTVSEEAYVYMIRLKTAALLGFSLEFGGMMAGTSDENRRLLRETGENVGVGFQLKDDLLDVFGDQTKVGKRVGGDIIANKKTFLLINALRLAQGHDAQQLQYWLTQKNPDNAEKVRAVTQIYERLGIRSLTEQKMNEYFAVGMRCLDAVTADPDRKATLRAFVDGIIQRDK